MIYRNHFYLNKRNQMKATILKMASLMLAMTMSMPLMSCGDDDDDDDIIPPVTGETANLPVSITTNGRSMYTFNYDSEGRLTGSRCSTKMTPSPSR